MSSSTPQHFGSGFGGRSARSIDPYVTSCLTGNLDPSAIVIPSDMRSASELQLTVLAALEDRGFTLGGWKLGFTSPETRQRAGLSEALMGYLLARNVEVSDSEVELAWAPHLKLEAELGFTLSRDLAGAITVDAVADSLATVSAAFEVLHYRYSEGTDIKVILVDNLAQYRVVVGTSTTSIGAAAETVLTVTDPLGNHTQTAADVDDHLQSIVDVAKRLTRFGRHLRAGDKILTGSYALYDIDRPGSWAAEFSGIGAVTVRFS